MLNSEENWTENTCPMMVDAQYCKKINMNAVFVKGKTEQEAVI